MVLLTILLSKRLVIDLVNKVSHGVWSSLPVTMSRYPECCTVTYLTTIAEHMGQAVVQFAVGYCRIRRKCLVPGAPENFLEFTKTNIQVAHSWHLGALMVHAF